jgi:FkbM family methyltransferase
VSFSGLKQMLGEFTPRIARRAAVRLGAFYERFEQHSRPVRFPSQEGAFHTLKKHGWSPKSCIDVGAYHGEWAAMFLGIFPESRVLMLEAQEGKRAALEESAARSGGRTSLAIALLGAVDGQEVEFAEMETGSSVYSEASPFARTVVRKPLTTLDRLLADWPAFAAPQCLKIDTQGYELEVLKGASRTLRQVDAVLMEVSLLQVNAGCPTFAEVISFMNDAGFTVFDFCSQIRRRDGVLWQTDLLFVRRAGGIQINPRLTHANWG